MQLTNEMHSIGINDWFIVYSTLYQFCYRLDPLYTFLKNKACVLEVFLELLSFYLFWRAKSWQAEIRLLYAGYNQFLCQI